MTFLTRSDPKHCSAITTHSDPYNFSQGRTSKEVEGVSEKGLDVRFKEIE